MKLGVKLRLARDREGGAFCFAHFLRRRRNGASAHGLPCMASRLRQREALLRETLPTPPFTSLRRTPHPPDQVTLLQFDGRKAEAHPAEDGRCPDPVSKGGESGAARLGGHGRNRVPVVLGAHRAWEPSK